MPSLYSPLAFLLNKVKVLTHFLSATQKHKTSLLYKNCILLTAVIQYHSKTKMKTYKSCLFYPLVILHILYIIFRHKIEVIMYLLKQVTNVLSVDILAKFQRPFMKPYNFTTRLHRVTTKSFLDLLDDLAFHYVSCE